MGARQTKRHLEIPELIQKNPGITLEELLEKLQDIGFKLSKRTLERDLEWFRNNYEVTIEFNRLNKGYFLKEEESKDIKALQRLREYANQTELFRIVQDREFKELIEFEQALEGPDSRTFAQIALAIRDQKLIELKYIRYGYSESKTHVVQPRMLKEYMHRWYVITSHPDRKDTLVFSLDKNRLLSLQVLSEYFKPVEKLATIRKRFENIIGISVYEDYSAELIVIAVPHEQAGYIESQPWHVSQELIRESETEKYFSFWLSWNIELEKKILNFIPYIRVVEPKYLEERIIELLEENLALYKPTNGR
jgi:predicted DNA-binding transcriptional regulator YafY